MNTRIFSYSFFINLLIVLSLISSNSYACSFRRLNLALINSTSAIMEISENKKYLIKLIPSRWRKGKTSSDFIKIREPYGIVFKINDRGKLEYLWSMKDIYTTDIIKREGFTIYLSNDGNSVIRVDSSPRISYSENDDPSMSNTVISIFRRGKLIKKIPLKSFVSKSFLKRQGRNSCSTVRWYTEISMADTLYIKTIDGKNWNIYPRTGLASQNQ